MQSIESNEEIDPQRVVGVSKDSYTDEMHRYLSCEEGNNGEAGPKLGTGRRGRWGGARYGMRYGMIEEGVGVSK
jgi:hypothetical protein